MRLVDAYPWIRERFADFREGPGVYCQAACPLKCHRSAHLKLWLGSDGRLMFGCYAECNKLEILRAVGAGWADCFPDKQVPDKPNQEVTARYDYRDEGGAVLYQTIRLEPGTRGRDKDFRQRRPDPTAAGKWVYNLEGVRRVLYRLPELLAADPHREVYAVAGEKDADTLARLGLVATTNVCGERSEWLDTYSAQLKGRAVVVIEDRDSAGRRHANEVVGSLTGYAASVRRVVLPEKDATAFVNRLRRDGVTAPAELVAALEAEVNQYPIWVSVRAA